MASLEKPRYKFFRGVFPSWDNTPRRQNSSAIFINSSPDLYKLFLKATLALTRAEHAGDEQLVFINAWNEWAEGAHLEPDQKYGMRWLEATKEAMDEVDDKADALEALRSHCGEDALKVPGLSTQSQNAQLQFESPLSSEIDVILNSYTFRAGKLILWFPIRILTLYKRLTKKKHE